jgi:hypothetical protein
MTRFFHAFFEILKSKRLWCSGPAVVIYLIVLSGVDGLYDLFWKAAILLAFFVFIALIAALSNERDSSTAA